VYLRALEIQGFKSFPDKTVLTFGEDITAIVGPNGSGKSNISDAIRWVMGEQSTRALRGGKMEDVIFGGTAKRKQTGYAEVSLVLDNTTHLFNMEESEVMVTRRYYRSGESEYYINRRSVRLKDVNELFMDTGRALPQWTQKLGASWPLWAADTSREADTLWDTSDGALGITCSNPKNMNLMAANRTTMRRMPPTIIFQSPDFFSFSFIGYSALSLRRSG